MIISSIICIVVSFLIGGIPFGFLIAKKMAGINIQEYGSGNIGSTNVGRIVGKKASHYTQYCDIGKGILTTLIVFLLDKFTNLPFYENILPLVAFATILGHDFTPFLKFKGGKGVNTTLGASLLVCLWFSPIIVFLSVVSYYSVKKLTKYVSLGSISIAITLPIFYTILSLIFKQFNFVLLIYYVAAGLLMVLKHHANISRLIHHDENKAV